MEEKERKGRRTEGKRVEVGEHEVRGEGKYEGE